MRYLEHRCAHGRHLDNANRLTRIERAHVSPVTRCWPLKSSQRASCSSSQAAAPAWSSLAGFGRRISAVGSAAGQVRTPLPRLRMGSPFPSRRVDCASHLGCVAALHELAIRNTKGYATNVTHVAHRELVVASWKI